MYLDPAFGGMLVQVIIAIIAVGGGLFFAFKKRIRMLFSRNKSGNRPKTKEASSVGKTIDALSDDEQDN